MRRQLMVTAAAVATMIVLAFVVPLGVLVRQLAADRATRAGEQQAAALVPVLATVSNGDQIRAVVDGSNTGDPASISVVLPDGTVLGTPIPDSASAADVVLARTQGSSFSIDEEGGRALYVPVIKAGGQVAVVRAFVPESVLTRGVLGAWLVLGMLGIVLVGVAVALADRLGRAVVVPVRALADTAERLGRGELDARVAPDGPAEIVEVGETLNRLAGRIDELIVAERESVADLSHRLRTPITALKLDAEAVQDPIERNRLMDDVEALQIAVTKAINDARRIAPSASSEPSAPSVPSGTDLGIVVHERVSFWSVLAEDQGRTYLLEVTPGPMPVPVGADELGAALDALLGNVLAHTDDGIAFRVQARSHDGRAELVVEDDGAGFPPGSDPRQRGRSGGGSTGLGLDIAARTASAAGGSMTVGASPSGGARIVIVLPLVGGRGSRDTTTQAAAPTASHRF